MAGYPTKKVPKNTVDIKGFSGMNNVKSTERFYSAEDIAEPRIILNSDVDMAGQLMIRKGQTLLVALPGAHSLWAGDQCMLCVAGGVLYRISQGVKVSLGSVHVNDAPYCYVEAIGKVYISNAYWNGVLNPVTNALTSWGVALPPSPVMIPANGNLPPGNYNVCMTNISGTEMSGNGGISAIELTATGGIQILNRPAGAIVWVTDANEDVFYRVGAINTVVDIPTVEPLPSFLCSPPPCMENLCYAFGRMWGSVENVVYYSEPTQIGWFRLSSNYFIFDSPVTVIAKTPTGLFIGMRDRTKYLAGTEPEKMEQSDAGCGSIKGTLVYCNNMPELGWTLGTPEKSFMDVPVWVTVEGIVVGSPTGKFFNLTKNKLKMGVPLRGASLYRNLNGALQILTSFQSGAVGSGVGFRDTETFDAFKNGYIAAFNKALGGSNSQASFSDTATCTVTRGGVQI
jgi:hypothetical protein